MAISFHYKVILRTDRINGQGLAPVLLRVTINRVVRYYNLLIHINPSLWDENKMRIKGNNDYAIKSNYIISQAIKKADDYLFECISLEKNPSFQEWELFFGNKRLRDKVYVAEFMQYYINLNKHLYSKETIRTYTSQITKLNQYNPILKFSDIDERFIKDYQKYMIEKLGNRENTYFKSLSFLRTVCNLAKREGILQKNPFDGFKIRKYEGYREYLNDDELKRLIKLHNEDAHLITKNEHHCLTYFLLACFTGLRYSDIRKLKKQQIIDNYIILEQQKTKRIVKIPLNEYAKKIIFNIPGFKDILPQIPILRTFTNQATNRILKRIAITAQIKKNLTFHVARHTFATISINLNIPLEVIRELMGHRDIKTTLIYAKILDSTKEREIAKWNMF
jgi:integrase